MGVTESKLASHGQQQRQQPSAAPLLKSPPSEVELKDMLLRHVQSSEYGALDPTTTASLFTLYHEWQRVTSQKVNKNQ
ncbi:hypothetical protein L7F22_063265, partial [Adiantum nelumboides]|nr:hypothetical protein [Adiantum nelumboides]